MVEAGNVEVARTIEARALTEEAWSPYGYLPVADTDPATAPTVSTTSGPTPT